MSCHSEEVCFLNRHGQKITGIIHIPNQALSKDSFVLLCHGLLAHKDAFFMPALAQSLPFISFRFDFPCLQSDNKSFRYASFDEDSQDISEVVAFVYQKYDLSIIGLIGHSRGVNVSLKWIASTRPSSLWFLVMVAGRFYMPAGPKKHLKASLAALEEKGSFEWNVSIKGKNHTLVITKEMVDKFGNATPLQVVNSMSFPALIIHGTSDKMIPVNDAILFANHLTHSSLVLIPFADHLFRSANAVEKGQETHQEKLLSTITDWILEQKPQCASIDGKALPSASL
ncbi:hypothetical protein MDAP_000671 [Mitosporidium daphniae]